MKDMPLPPIYNDSDLSLDGFIDEFAALLEKYNALINVDITSYVPHESPEVGMTIVVDSKNKKTGDTFTFDDVCSFSLTSETVRDRNKGTYGIHIP